MSADRFAQPKHPAAWSNEEAAQAAYDAFAVTLRKLIEGDIQRDEWTEAERLALRLGQYLGVTIAMGLTLKPKELRILRTATAAFEPPDEGVQRRRLGAVEAVALAGSEYLSVGNDEGRAAAVVDLAHQLSGSDPGFEDFIGPMNIVPLDVDLSWIEARLKSYDPAPKGKPGAKGAERILAEMIALDLDAGGALGLAAAEGEGDEDAIDRIRKILVRDVGKLLAEDAKASETPD